VHSANLIAGSDRSAAAQPGPAIPSALPGIPPSNRRYRRRVARAACDTRARLSQCGSSPPGTAMTMPGCRRLQRERSFLQVALRDLGKFDREVRSTFSGSRPAWIAQSITKSMNAAQQLAECSLARFDLLPSWARHLLSRRSVRINWISKEPCRQARCRPVHRASPCERLRPCPGL
jgi:hypothetical protein